MDRHIFATGQPLAVDPRCPMVLPGELVGVAGDWESQGRRAVKQIGWIKYVAPEVRVILQLGDLRFRVDDGSGTHAARPHAAFLAAVDAACDRHGIDAILVTPGNHDDWGRMSAWWRDNPWTAMPVSKHVRMMPRGARFSIGRRTFLSFGGAVSVNQKWLTAGRDWWPEEAPTAADVDEAAAAGDVDVLLLHEAPNAGIGAVEAAASGSRNRRLDHLDESRVSRAFVTRLRQRTNPTVTFHGHMDRAGSARAADGSVVHSLADATSPGNAGVLRLSDLSWRWLDPLAVILGDGPVIEVEKR